MNELHRRDFIKGTIFGSVMAGVVASRPAQADDPRRVVIVEDIDAEPQLPPVYPTGIADLDAILAGGLHRGLYLVMGGVAVGKTTLIRQIAKANPGEYQIVVPLFSPGLKFDSTDNLQSEHPRGRKLILIDGLLPNEVWPDMHASTSAESLCRMAFEYDLTVVATVPLSHPRNEPHLYDLDNAFHSLRPANGGWVLDGDKLSVIKERYGKGQYAPNQGIVPWGPGKSQIFGWTAHWTRCNNV